MLLEGYIQINNPLKRTMTLTMAAPLSNCCTPLYCGWCVAIMWVKKRNLQLIVWRYFFLPSYLEIEYWDRGLYSDSNIKGEVNAALVVVGTFWGSHEIVFIYIWPTPKPVMMLLAYPRERHHGSLLAFKRRRTKQAVCLDSQQQSIEVCCSYGWCTGLICWVQQGAMHQSHKVKRCGLNTIHYYFNDIMKYFFSYKQ